MIKIIKKSKEEVTIKHPNGKVDRLSWENFNEYFTIGKNNEAVLKSIPRIEEANTILEEAIKLAIQKLKNKYDKTIQAQIDEKVDSILSILKADSSQRKRVEHLIWREANEESTSGTRLGDMILNFNDVKDKFNKGK